MRITELCANWQELMDLYPSFKCLRANPSRIFTEGSLKALYPALNSTELGTVMALFGSTAQEVATLRHDLATLIGVGKGSNGLTAQMPSFVAKFSFDHVAWMNDPMFISKMCTCVNHARALGTAVVNAFSAQTDSIDYRVLCEAMKFHFLVGPDDDTWDDIRQRMIITRTGLAGSFRLAATAKDTDFAGYVNTKAASTNFPQSPNTISWRDGYNRELVSGSIHIDYGLFKTPPIATARGTGYLLKQLTIAAIIFHEATHRWVQTDDDSGYLWEAPYHRAYPDVRLNNADCYAWVAASVWLGRVIKSETDPEVMM